MSRHSTSSSQAVPTAITLGEHHDERHEVDGRFENEERAVRSAVVKAAARIAAFDADAEAASVAVGAALVGMTGDAVFIPSDKHRVVIRNILVVSLSRFFVDFFHSLTSFRV